MAVINRTAEPAVAENAAASEDAAPAATTEQTTTSAAPARRRWWARRPWARRPWGSRRRDTAAVTDADRAPAATARPSARTRVAAAGAETAVLVARVIRTIAGIVALIIALGIAFVVLKATPTNTIVSHVHSWAKWLVGPFDGMFHLHGARATVALNWGIALVVYLLIGSLLARIALTPARAFRRRTAAV